MNRARTLIMFTRLYSLALLVMMRIQYVAGMDPTDSYSDADPAQSGYLPNHNMDPAIVDSSEFGQLWKTPFNNLEQVGLLQDLSSVLHNGHDS